MNALVNVLYLDNELHQKKVAEEKNGEKTWKETGEIDWYVQIAEYNPMTGKVDVRRLVSDTEPPKDWGFLDLVEVKVDIGAIDREGKQRVRIAGFGKLIEKSHFFDHAKGRQA